MAIVYAPRTVEIAVIHTIQNRPAVNVWHLQSSEEWWPAEAEAMVEDFRNNWQDHMLDLVASDLQLQRFEWRSLDENDGTVGVVNPDPAKSLVGQAGGSSMPPNSAVLIRKNTSNRPRGARDGRSFLAGAPLPNIFEDGTYNSTYIATANAALQAFYDGISDTGTWTNNGRYPVVLETTAASRAPGSQPVTVNVRRVTSITLDPLLSTQRDRLR